MCGPESASCFCLLKDGEIEGPLLKSEKSQLDDKKLKPQIIY